MFDKSHRENETALKRLAEFKNSGDTLRIYRNGKRLFTSDKGSLLPLIDYISHFDTSIPVIMLDKVLGNAAALLAVKAGAKQVYTPLGSQYAFNTLGFYKIDCFFESTIAYILNYSNIDICPMEKLSLNKDPETFFKAIKKLFLPYNTK
jgi:hypothetical protein